MPLTYAHVQNAVCTQTTPSSSCVLWKYFNAINETVICLTATLSLSGVVVGSWKSLMLNIQIRTHYNSLILEDTIGKLWVIFRHLQYYYIHENLSDSGEMLLYTYSYSQFLALYLELGVCVQFRNCNLTYLPLNNILKSFILLLFMVPKVYLFHRFSLLKFFIEFSIPLNILIMND